MDEFTKQESFNIWMINVGSDLRDELTNDFDEKELS